MITTVARRQGNAQQRITDARDRDWAHDVLSALERLDRNQAAIVQAVYLKGMTQKQVAARLALPAPVVAKQMATALQRLAGFLTERRAVPVT